MATIPKCRRWLRFASKLQLAARLVEWIVPMVKKAGKTVWIVVDGGYTKRPFLKRVLKTGVTVSDSPWDDVQRRPSHANRRKALRHHLLGNELSTLTAAWSLPHKIIQWAEHLLALAA
jgi:hypothetical protein